MLPRPGRPRSTRVDESRLGEREREILRERESSEAARVKKAGRN